MKVFHCDHCGQLVFFENVNCVQCGHVLAYAPDLGVMTSLDPVGDNLWTSPLPGAAGKRYRLCTNYENQRICNWLVPADDFNPFCESCRLTRTIPNLSVEGHREAWYKLEVAKRRLVYTLRHIGLRVISKSIDRKNGLTFDFLADSPVPGGSRVMTGHEEGVITLNLVEADDVERERRRLAMHEPYRTVLGHFRHEVGHYYWDQLIRGSDRINDFRDLFGDDRMDYGESLRRHYQQGAPPDWQEHYVSAYATSHAWEDWAETWAHYLHIIDTLETASSCGITLKPSREDEPSLSDVPNPVVNHNVKFSEMMRHWTPLTYLLNNLNRGLGIGDAYPFVLSPPVIDKLRFVHRTICHACSPNELPDNVRP